MLTWKDDLHDPGLEHKALQEAGSGGAWGQWGKGRGAVAAQEKQVKRDNGSCAGQKHTQLARPTHSGVVLEIMFECADASASFSSTGGAVVYCGHHLTCDEPGVLDQLSQELQVVGHTLQGGASNGSLHLGNSSLPAGANTANSSIRSSRRGVYTVLAGAGSRVSHHKLQLTIIVGAMGYV